MIGEVAVDGMRKYILVTKLMPGVFLDMDLIHPDVPMQVFF